MTEKGYSVRSHDDWIGINSSKKEKQLELTVDNMSAQYGMEGAPAFSLYSFDDYLGRIQPPSWNKGDKWMLQINAGNDNIITVSIPENVVDKILKDAKKRGWITDADYSR